MAYGNNGTKTGISPTQSTLWARIAALPSSFEVRLAFPQRRLGVGRKVKPVPSPDGHSKSFGRSYGESNMV
jgi:hypothetical protein